MDKYDRFWRFLGLSGLTILLSAFLLTLFGVVDLRVVSDVEVSPVIDFVVNFSLFIVNMYFVFSVSTGIFDYRIIKLLFIYIPFQFLTDLVLPTSLVTTVLAPLIFLIMAGIFINIRLGRLLIGFFSISMFTVIYQQLSGFIKLSGFGWQYYSGNCILLLLYSIDLVLFFTYIYKVVKKYGLEWKFLVLPQGKRISGSPELRKEVLSDDLTSRQRAIFAILSQGYQVFQLLVVLGIGMLNNAIAELAIILAMFWIGRKILQQSWHSEKLWICSCSAFTSFYILTKITPPLEVSLFMVVAISGLFIYIMHILGMKDERLEELERRYDDDYTKYGLSREMAAFAYDWLTAGLHDKELMVKYELSGENTLNSRKRRISHKMNTK